MSKRKEKRIAKKAAKSGSRKLQKQDTKMRKDFQLKVRVAGLNTALGMDDWHDRSILAANASRNNQKIETNLKKRAIASLPGGNTGNMDVKKKVLGYFFDLTGKNPMPRAVPKRRY
jgi:hypothetical protein